MNGGSTGPPMPNSPTVAMSGAGPASDENAATSGFSRSRGTAVADEEDGRVEGEAAVHLGLAGQSDRHARREQRGHGNGDGTTADRRGQRAQRADGDMLARGHTEGPQRGELRSIGAGLAPDGL